MRDFSHAHILYEGGSYMFNVINRSDKFIPSKANMSEYLDYVGLSSAPELCKFGRIFILETALHDLDKHIMWNQRRAENRVEQGGYMMGEVYEDDKTGVLFAVVKRMIPILNAKGTPTYLDMSAEASYEASQNENMIKSEGMRRVGWYHTHPGELNVFMSGVDRETQKKWYSEPWQFAVVLNPQRMIWAGFRGKEVQEVECLLLCKKNSVHENVFFNNEKYHSIVQRQILEQEQKENKEKSEENKEKSEENEQMVLNNDVAESMIDSTEGKDVNSITNNRIINNFSDFANELYNRIVLSDDKEMIKNVCIHGYVSVSNDAASIEDFYCEKVFFDFNNNKEVEMEFKQIPKDSYKVIIHLTKHYNIETIYNMLGASNEKSDRCYICVFNHTKTNTCYYIRDNLGNIHDGLINNSPKQKE